jgi:hypothetical protein
MPRFEFESRRFWWFYLYLSYVENYVCLSYGVYVIDAIWWAVTRIVAGVGDLVQRTGDSQAQIGYSVAGRSRCQVMMCKVCTMHKKMRSVSFLIWLENQGQ